MVLILRLRWGPSLTLLVSALMRAFTIPDLTVIGKFGEYHQYIEKIPI
jgi:hypothetical protein